jgi:hypothetical protein
MGLFYRKSVKLGPFRVNLSGSGIGYSLGGRGFRVGKSSRGRNYAAFSIPVAHPREGPEMVILGDWVASNKQGETTLMHATERKPCFSLRVLPPGLQRASDFVILHPFDPLQRHQLQV